MSKSPVHKDEIDTISLNRIPELQISVNDIIEESITSRKHARARLAVHRPNVTTHLPAALVLSSSREP
jgi:hypothetical protein